mmetsp:Transcript_4077/g.14593  ORF Transcript_4077/g.14593 Transcript_4077/m.14593 type:complete len:251 (+) Transcript_4077:341-1093(+)
MPRRRGRLWEYHRVWDFRQPYCLGYCCWIDGHGHSNHASSNQTTHTVNAMASTHVVRNTFAGSILIRVRLTYRQRQAQQAQLARMQDQIRFQGPNGLEQAGPQQYVIELAPDPHDFLPDPYTLDEADKLHDMLGEEYLCPICREVFRHPVKAADGHTYDRKCIKDWMRIKLSSPMTNERLANVDLVTDEEKESAVVEAVEKLRAQPQADRTVVDPSGDSEETVGEGAATETTDGENVEEDYPGTNPITKF